MTEETITAVNGTAEDGAPAERPVDLVEGTDIEVRFEVRGKVVDPEQVNRVGRRFLDSQATKFRKKYAATQGADGERPTIVIRKPDLVGIKAEVALEYPESMAGSVKGHGKATRVS